MDDRQQIKSLIAKALNVYYTMLADIRMVVGGVNWTCSIPRMVRAIDQLRTLDALTSATYMDSVTAIFALIICTLLATGW